MCPVARNGMLKKQQRLVYRVSSGHCAEALAGAPLRLLTGTCCCLSAKIDLYSAQVPVGSGSGQ